LKGLYNFGRDALLLETISIIAKCQNPETFWSDSMARLKWLLDFSRVDLALRNPDNRTYNLKTVFELRPGEPLAAHTGVPLDKGIVGKMMRSGEACHCFDLRIQPFDAECIVDVNLEGSSLRSILSVSLDANGKGLGVLIFGSSNENQYCHQDIEIASRFATHTAIALERWQHLADLKDNAGVLDLATDKLRISHILLESLVAKRTAALRRLSQQLMRMQDDERRKVARDLHDSTGQTLVALKMSLFSLQQKVENDPATANALEDIARIADQALQEIRTTSYLLHPPLLDEAGLASAASWYIEGFSKRSGLEVNFGCAPEIERLPNDIEIVLFRVLQESLSNVHRHSGASLVNIRLARSDESVLLEVQDNGVGMAPALLDSLQNTNIDAGVGLAGMRERTDDLNGQFEMESGPSGTTLRIRIPLSPDRATLSRSSTEISSASISAI
jgi:signal transduction histidine kinase